MLSRSWHFICALLSVLAANPLMTGISDASSFVWSKRTQICSTTYGTVVEFVRPGRADSVLVYAAIRQRGLVPNQEDPSWNHGSVGTLVALRPGSDWSSGWTARETFTQVDHRASDHHIIVDRFDNVHVVHEAFNHGDDEPPATALAIGYKNRSASNWSSANRPIMVASESGDEGSNYPCSSMSPHLFIQETGVADTLHCSFRRSSAGTDDCPEHHGWLTYRRTPLLSSDKWRTEGESYVTGEIGSAPLFVDPQGVVHFVATQSESIPGSPPYTRLTTLHYSGTAPAAGEEWETDAPDWQRDVISVSDSEGCTPQEPSNDDLDAEFDVPVIRGVGGYLYIAFHKFMNCKREIFLTRVNTSTGVIDTPVQLSPSGNISSARPELVITSDGTFHIMYNEPGSVGLSF